jgi:hypothetical protein
MPPLRWSAPAASDARASAPACLPQTGPHPVEENSAADILATHASGDLVVRTPPRFPCSGRSHPRSRSAALGSPVPSLRSSVFVGRLIVSTAGEVVQCALRRRDNPWEDPRPRGGEEPEGYSRTWLDWDVVGLPAGSRRASAWVTAIRCAWPPIVGLGCRVGSMLRVLPFEPRRRRRALRGFAHAVPQPRFNGTVRLR